MNPEGFLTKTFQQSGGVAWRRSNCAIKSPMPIGVTRTRIQQLVDQNASQSIQEHLKKVLVWHISIVLM